MPRGVPNSGQRKPRSVPAPYAEAETTVAAEALDTSDRVDPPAELEAWPVDPPVEPVIEQTVSPEQREIEQLREMLLQQQALLAKLTGTQLTAPPVPAAVQLRDDDNPIRIHFLEDGFTALNKVFYRGEELEFDRESQAYKDTLNKRGESWLDYRYDEFGQVDRWGRIFFRNGPWPGKTYADGTWENLRSEKGEGTIPPPTQEQLDRAEKLRQRREAPTLPPVDASA